MKKRIMLLMTVVFVLLINFCVAQNTGVAINTTGAIPAASSLLDVQSTTRGVLFPRMTSAQRTAITGPATGLMVYDNTSNSFWFQRSGTWLEVSPWSTATPSDHVYNNGLLPVVIKNGVSAAPREGTINVIHDGSTNTVEDVLAIYRATTSIATNGIGASILFRNETTSKVHALGARISVVNENASEGANLLHFTAYAAGMGQPQLFVSADGVGIGQAPTDNSSRLHITGNIRISGEIRRISTGSANMVPIAYGVITATGSVLSGTGNFSASRSAIGRYIVTVTDLLLDQGDIFNVTPVAATPRMVSTGVNASNAMEVFTYNQAGNFTDTQFSFVIYKP